MTETAIAEFVDFLNVAPSPYHAVDRMSARLIAAGFAELHGTDAWPAEPGTRCFTRRGGRSLMAWIAGTGAPETDGFRILGAHTDSPALKPRGVTLKAEDGAITLPVSVYGSPILQTWLDRDLGLAGRVCTRDAPGGLDYASQRLTVRAASLAIHLDRAARDTGLKVNPHSEANVLVASPDWSDGADLTALVAADLGIAADDVLAMDLTLYDRQPAALMPGDPGLLSAGRIDNLLSCHAGIAALAAREPTAHTALVALFDAEEIGSRTYLGAQSGLLGEVIERLCLARGLDRGGYHRAIAASTLISLDMAHAVHPFHAPALDPAQAPRLNGGVALKRSERGHYAMSPALEARLIGAARDRGLPLQDFRYREDLGGGTSIGPLVAAGLGIETLDAGIGCLGMHSIREVMGAADVAHAVDFCDLALGL